MSNNCTCGTPFAEHGPGACFDLAIYRARMAHLGELMTSILDSEHGARFIKEIGYSPTTSWADAGPLLEEMIAYRAPETMVGFDMEKDGTVECEIVGGGDHMKAEETWGAIGRADTLPLAICRAYMEWERD